MHQMIRTPDDDPSDSFPAVLFSARRRAVFNKNEWSFTDGSINASEQDARKRADEPDL